MDFSEPNSNQTVFTLQTALIVFNKSVNSLFKFLVISIKTNLKMNYYNSLLNFLVIYIFTIDLISDFKRLSVSYTMPRCLQ